MLTFAILLTLSQILIAYFIFTKEAREKSRQEHNNALLKLQLTALKRETENTRESLEKARILRHDLRHHYLLLHALLSQGDKETALEHIDRQCQELERPDEGAPAGID
jgi:hypothetical protein